MALRPPDVRKLLRRLLNEGVLVIPESHARPRMNENGLTDADAEHVLKHGTVLEGEWESGCWRYRVDVHASPHGIRFVVQFDEEFDDAMPADDADLSTKTIVVVTAMKLKH